MEVTVPGPPSVPAVQGVISLVSLLPPALPLLPTTVGPRPGLRHLAVVAGPVVGGVVPGPANTRRVGGGSGLGIFMFSRYQAEVEVVVVNSAAQTRGDDKVSAVVLLEISQLSSD